MHFCSLLQKTGGILHAIAIIKLVMRNRGWSQTKDGSLRSELIWLDRLSLGFVLVFFTHDSHHLEYEKNKIRAEMKWRIKYACVTVERFHCGLRVEISMLIRFRFNLFSALLLWEHRRGDSRAETGGGFLPKSGSCNVALFMIIKLTLLFYKFHA